MPFQATAELVNTAYLVRETPYMHCENVATFDQKALIEEVTFLASAHISALTYNCQ